MSFFNICCERKQLEGARCMNVLANVPFVFINENIRVLCLLFFCESVCAVFHTSPSLLSSSQNYLLSVSLSRLHCLHHACTSHCPQKPLDFHCTLCIIYHRSMLSARHLWKRNLNPLMKRSSLFHYVSRYQLSLFPSSIQQRESHLVHNCHN